MIAIALATSIGVLGHVVICWNARLELLTALWGIVLGGFIVLLWRAWRKSADSLQPSVRLIIAGALLVTAMAWVAAPSLDQIHEEDEEPLPLVDLALTLCISAAVCVSLKLHQRARSAVIGIALCVMNADLAFLLGPASELLVAGKLRDPVGYWPAPLLFGVLALALSAACLSLASRREAALLGGGRWTTTAKSEGKSGAP